jgi:hypothetical protein
MSSLLTQKKLTNLSERGHASIFISSDPHVQDNGKGVPFNLFYLRMEAKLLSETLCPIFVLLNNGW